MDVKQLQLIALIVSEGSFSAAARRAGLTQPTLSKVVSRLESELGARLFHRESGSTRPTDLGRLLAERAQAITTMLEETERDARLHDAGKFGQLRIGVGPVTRIKPLVQLVPLMLEEHPGVRVRIVSSSGPALAEGVAKDRFDVAFSYSGNAIRFGDLLRIKIFEDDIVVAGRANHPIWKNGPIDPAAILKFPMASSGLVPAFFTWSGPLTQHQQRNAQSFITDDTDLIHALLATGDHLSYGPAFMFADAARMGQVVTHPLAWPERFECWMLTTVAKWQSPLIRSIAALAKQAAGQSDSPAI